MSIKGHSHPIIEAEETASSNSNCDIKSPNASTLSWWHRLPVLLSTLLLSLGASYTATALKVLKPRIMENTYYHGHLIDNAKFGVMTSASFLVNTILPIISGVFVDYYGPTYVSLVFSTLIVVGCTMTAIGARQGDFNLITGGDILSGVGNITIQTCQYKLYTHWFRGSLEGLTGAIGLVVGLDIAVTRLYGLLATVTPEPLREATGLWYFAFWLGTIFSCIAWLLNLFYIIYELTLPVSTRIQPSIVVARERAHAKTFWRKFQSHLKQVGSSIFLLPASFWVINVSQLLQSGVIDAYENGTVDMIVYTRGKGMSADIKKASYTYSMHYAIPIALTGLFGFLFDRLGHRAHVISLSAIFYIIAMSTLAFSTVHPACPLLFDALAYAMNKVPFLATIVLLVRDQASIGTAFGVFNAYYSAGSTIAQVSGGALQDLALSQGLPKSKKYNYMMYFVLSIKSLDVVLGMLYHYLDSKYFGRVMLLSEKQRVTQEIELKETGFSSTKKKSSLSVARKEWTLIGCTVGVVIIVVSYTVFLVYWIRDNNIVSG